MAFLKSNLLFTVQKYSFSPRFPFAFSLLSGVLVAFLFFSGLLDKIEMVAYDWRFVRSPRDTPSGKVSVVYINDATLTNMQDFLGRWPWSRDNWAAFQSLILDKVGVVNTVYDIVFDLPDENKAKDLVFAESMDKSNNVFLSCLFRDPQDRIIPVEERTRYNSDWRPPPEAMQRFAFSLPSDVRWQLQSQLPDHMAATLPMIEFLKAAKGCGGITYQPDADGVLRRFPLMHRLAGQIYPSVPLLVAADVLGVSVSDIEIIPGKRIVLPFPSRKSLEIPINARGEMLVNFRSEDPGALPCLNFAAAWEAFAEWQSTGKPGELGVIRDTTVIVGSIAEATEDIGAIPLAERYPMTFTVTTVVDNILKGDFLRETHWGIDFLSILLCAVLVGLWSAKFRPSVRLVLTMLQSVLYLKLNCFVFRRWGLCVPIIAPELAIAFPFTVVLLVKYAFERNARRYAENLFGRYLDKEIVSELIRKPDIIGLGGETRKVSILFSDLCSFTTISEKMKSDEVVTMLNEYFEEMAKAISAENGMVDKYVGDSIMVLFGLPSAKPDDALHAVRCGLAMLERLKKRKEEPDPGVFSALNMRIGINTGNVTAGNIGTEFRQQYTVIGDMVNVADRFESMAPRNGVLISQTTYQEVAEHVEAIPLGGIQVKGKAGEIQAYQVTGLKEQ